MLLSTETQAVFDNDVDYLEILLDHAVEAQEEEKEARMGTSLEGAAPVRKGGGDTRVSTRAGPRTVGGRAKPERCTCSTIRQDSYSGGISALGGTSTHQLHMKRPNDATYWLSEGACAYQANTVDSTRNR